MQLVLYFVTVSHIKVNGTETEADIVAMATHIPIDLCSICIVWVCVKMPIVYVYTLWYECVHLLLLLLLWTRLTIMANLFFIKLNIAVTVANVLCNSLSKWKRSLNSLLFRKS